MKVKKSNLSYLIFILPSMIGVGIFIVIPFIDVIRRSYYNAMANQFVGLDNYKAVIYNSAFQIAVWNTFRFAITAIPLLLIVFDFVTDKSGYG